MIVTKRAFLFGGQGAQKLGMASDLYAAYPIVKETFDTASRILGYDLRELIDSNEEKLNQTRYTQPAILTDLPKGSKTLDVWTRTCSPG